MVENKQCTLSNEELIRRSTDWVTSLAKSRGYNWVLSIPVNFNRDPDMLFLELCKRLEKSNEQISSLQTQLEEVTHERDRYKKESEFFNEQLNEKQERIKQLEEQLKT